MVSMEARHSSVMAHFCAGKSQDIFLCLSLQFFPFFWVPSLSLQANSAVALHQLNHCIRELGAAVAERQGALAVALEGSRSRREEALSAQVSERRGLLENVGLMAYTQELLKETDAPCFVQAARITHNR